MPFRRICLALLCATMLPYAATADDIEAFFAERGPLAIAVQENTGPDGSFTLFAPAEPGTAGIRYPLLTWGNGTFASPEDYFGLLDHFASHGFVVIASNSGFTGSGVQMLEGVDWVLEENEDPASALFDSVNPSTIGATGHSQGGGGTINAGTDQRIRCTAPIQPIPGNIDELQGPTLVLAGGQDFIVPAAGIAENTVAPSPVLTVFGILRDGTHFDPTGDGGGYRGYLTAWFSACLRGNQTAFQAFFTPCTLCDNPDWLVFRKPAT